jgi:hypothetical protein
MAGLEGYDRDKFNDPNKSDPKYDFGHIVGGVPPTPAGLDSVWDQIKQKFPSAVRVDADEVDFDGPGGEPPVDVIRGAGNGGEAWHWEPTGTGSPQSAASAAPVTTTGSSPLASPGAAQLAAPLGNNNVLQQIMDELRRIQNGEAPRNALLQQMGLV